MGLHHQVQVFLPKYFVLLLLSPLQIQIAKSSVDVGRANPSVHVYLQWNAIIYLNLDCRFSNFE